MGNVGTMMSVPIESDLSASHFYNHVLPQSQPVIYRGLVNHWPIVQAARLSDGEFCDYLADLDAGHRTHLTIIPPEAKGVCHYDESLTKVNFNLQTAFIEDILKRLQSPPNDGTGLYVQSLACEKYFPRLSSNHKLDLVPDGISPRLWLGTDVTTQTHYDLNQNIACVIAGKRRFTLFPPDQVINLYPGPDDFTPGGAPLSLPDLRHPDFEKWPRLKKALDTALIADLEIGDALYIPYGWWHQVQSLSKFNALINFWWNEARLDRPLPRFAFKAALLAVRDLPPAQKAIWKQLFDLYVFGEDETFLDHLPHNVRGQHSKPLSASQLQKLKSDIIAYVSHL